MNVNEEALQVLEMQLKDVSLVHVTIVDLSGVCRGKVIPAREIKGLAIRGMTMLNAVTCLGPRTEMSGLPEEIAEANLGNGVLRLDINSFYKIPPVIQDGATSKPILAEIFCENRWDVTRPMEADPRYLVNRQLSMLKEKWNLQLYSAFEHEFYLVNAPTMECTFDGSDFLTTKTHNDYADFLVTLERHLFDVGVQVEAMHAEYGKGMWEVAVKPHFGIKGADIVLRLKSAVKRVASKMGYKASFMSKPFPDSGGSSFHFNHSLWESNGKDALYDATKENKMSDIGRYWLGGLLKHAAALTALCCPTVNDYRRLHTVFAPDKADWGIESRHATINVKTGTGNSCFYENRLPTSACIPHVVMAATIAAGIDGLTNKIEPLVDMQDAPKLPSTLQESLAALENDTTLVDILGPTFVRWFITLKRGVDIQKLENSDVQIEDEKMYAAEKKLYFDFL